MTPRSFPGISRDDIFDLWGMYIRQLLANGSNGLHYKTPCGKHRLEWARRTARGFPVISNPSRLHPLEQNPTGIKWTKGEFCGFLNLFFRPGGCFFTSDPSSFRRGHSRKIFWPGRLASLIDSLPTYSVGSLLEILPEEFSGWHSKCIFSKNRGIVRVMPRSHQLETISQLFSNFL